MVKLLQDVCIYTHLSHTPQTTWGTPIQLQHISCPKHVPLCRQRGTCLSIERSSMDNNFANAIQEFLSIWQSLSVFCKESCKCTVHNSSSCLINAPQMCSCHLWIHKPDSGSRLVFGVIVLMGIQWYVITSVWQIASHSALEYLVCGEVYGQVSVTARCPGHVAAIQAKSSALYHYAWQLVCDVFADVLCLFFLFCCCFL